MGIVNLFEMVEVEKDQRERTVVPLCPLSFVIDQFIEMAGVVESGQIISDDELIYFFEILGIFDGDRHIIGDGGQDRQGRFIEGPLVPALTSSITPRIRLRLFSGTQMMERVSCEVIWSTSDEK